MKQKIYLLVLIILSSLYVGAHAQEYCLSAPFGYGSNATGGTGGTVVTVSTVADLKTYCNKSGKYIILIDGTLTFTSHLSVTPIDKTIIGLPGSLLYSEQRDAAGSNSGILYISNGSNNVILRNLTFESAGAYDCDGWDNLCIDGGTDIWVDHCDFQDGVDGNFDNKGDADNITVTWCRFRYLKDPLAGGSGGTDDHRFSNLLGSSSTDAPSDGTFSFTWAYCWWDNGCVERMLRCRNAELDFISCYWNSADANYYIGPQNVSVYAEGCYFSGLSSSKIFYQNYGGTNYCNFVNSYGSVNGVPAASGDVSAPTYDYTAYSYDKTQEYVTSDCGAGATLEVDSSTGEVSSSCNSQLSTPSNFSTSVTSNSATISWDAVENAGSYVVNFCTPEGNSTSTPQVTALLDDATNTSGYFTLSSGDKLNTTATAGNSSTACVPSDITSTVYRTSSANDYSLELSATTPVTEITFGGRSSGTDSNRTLTSYTINGGSAQTDNISGQITAQACATEITISGLNLAQGDVIAFTFSGNVQLSYFILTTSEVTYTCEETEVSNTSYTITGLSANTTYSYQVKAITSSTDYEDSDYSDDQSVTTTSTSTGIKAESLKDFTFIQTNTEITVGGITVNEMNLYNIAGLKITSTNEQSLNISYLNTGIYIVTIKTSDNQFISKKIVLD